tara:strand:- start:1307 stop:3745 length:2439 start_codon:yes stop_codon:yes gene_type:complete
MTSKPRFQNGSGFPNQFAQDAEKESLEYGLRVGQAIESEWFSREHDTALYNELRSEYLRRRLYAKGNQPVDKYKNELSVNGDLSYLNLDWTPIPIIPKFVDVVVNGISNRMFDVRVESLDESSNEKRQGFRDEMQADMIAKPVLEQLKKDTGVDAFNFDSNTLPDTDEELDLYMKLSYKQSIEVAEETAITSILKYNDYDEIKRRCDEDQTVLGMSVAKHKFDVHDGVRLEYVDPVNFVYSPTEDPNFRNCYYFGEVKSVHVSELKKISPDLTQDELEEIATLASRFIGNNGSQNSTSQSGLDKNEVSLLYFSYKTDKEISYKIKETVNGGKKAIQKDGSFNPPKTEQSRFTKASRRIDVWYEGVLVLGTNRLMKWELMKNMVRPSSAFQKTIPPYIVSAMKLSKGDIDSLVKRMIPFADQIQLIHLKLQQVIAKMIPDGVFIDADGLNSVDLGNGASYNPSEALNMYFQTGSVVGRSYTEDGEYNHSKVPIQELNSSGSNAKISSLISMYNYNLNMLRAATGLNEARDGSSPDQYALVGVQKLAALNSNTATRHIMLSGVNLTTRLCEAVSYRISDILEYAPFASDFAKMIGRNNVQILNEIKNLHLHDFGVYIDLEPDEEQRQLLEQNIQQSISAKVIELDDAIDIRSIRNITLANTLLKIRKQRKQKMDMQLQKRNIDMQTQSNVQSTQAASKTRMQESQMDMKSATQLEQLKAQIRMQEMEKKAEIDKELLETKYMFEIKLKEAEVQSVRGRDMEKEDRKDKRTEKQATQQSAMIDQRKAESGPKDFERKAAPQGLGMSDLMGGNLPL